MMATWEERNKIWFVPPVCLQMMEENRINII